MQKIIQRCASASFVSAIATVALWAGNGPGIIDPTPGPIFGQLNLHAFGTTCQAGDFVRVELLITPLAGGMVATPGVIEMPDFAVPGNQTAAAWGPAFLYGVVAASNNWLIATGPLVDTGFNDVFIPINSAAGARVAIRMISATQGSPDPLPATPYMPPLIPGAPPVLPCCQIAPMPATPAQVLGDDTYAWPAYTNPPGTAPWCHLGRHFFAAPPQLAPNYSVGVDLRSDYGQVVTYCTAGVSTHACAPAMSASGDPSVSALSGFTLTCSSVEGQKIGLMFYGVNGAVAVPWGVGSSSYQCVGAPQQRTPVAYTGGTDGACDGSITLDFLAFVASNPATRGAPFSAGDKAWFQTWYRDPPAAKTTNLSNALQVTLSP